jgi:hypothetical protein
VGCAVAVNKRTQGSEMIVEDYEKSVDETCYSITTQEMVISGLPAIKYYNTIHDADSPQCSRYTLVYVQNKIHIVVNKENYTYLLWFNSNHNDETENQILSTFKFTN